MILIRSIKRTEAIIPPSCLTIGNFDGVHRGHAQIIEQLKKIAREKNLASAVLTFEPHPISYLDPDKSYDFRITSLAQKIKIFQELKIDYLIVLPFNKEFSDINHVDFINEILIKKLNSKHLVVGYDFTFGKDRQGNFKTLENYNFDLSEVAPIRFLNKERSEIFEHTFSSSLVRKAIKNGDIKVVNEILQRNFVVEGIVINGGKLGNKIGFPTANISAKPHLIKPKFGVYKTQTIIPHLKKKFLSITNFGVRPTIDKQGNKPIFENHIFDFSQEIYGKKIIIEFIDFVREEKKFSNLEELKKQISKDIFFASKK